MEFFDQIGEYIFKCKECGAEVASGIANISDHWVSCTGSKFTAALKESYNTGKLSIKDVEELRELLINQK